MRFNCIVSVLSIIAFVSGCADGPVVQSAGGQVSMQDLERRLGASQIRSTSSAQAPSALERSLTSRLLARFPEGDARDYMKASLEGRIALSSRPTITSDPVAQAMLDSIYAIRSATHALANRTAQPKR